MFVNWYEMSRSGQMKVEARRYEAAEYRLAKQVTKQERNRGAYAPNVARLGRALSTLIVRLRAWYVATS